MEFAAIFQMPTIGADVCGFNYETWETLCTRWAVLGAWYPFYRNHADITAPFQEFYRWPQVADAARAAIKTRYQLLDYFYTEFHYQTVDGTPSTILPLFFLYPNDPNTLDIELQFFYGSALLISPVTDDESTTVTFYLPADTWYNFFTGEKLSVPSSSSSSPEQGTWITRSDVAYDEISVHIRGGSIIPMRVDGANTTTQLRQLDFELIIAPGTDGLAEGRLYLDDGESVDQPTTEDGRRATSEISFTYDSETSKLYVRGKFGYETNVKIASVSVLGDGNGNSNNVENQTPTSVRFQYCRTVAVDESLTGEFSLYIG
jgi:alpha-glucosidase